MSDFDYGDNASPYVDDLSRGAPRILLADSSGVALSWLQDGVLCFRVPNDSDPTGWGVLRLTEAQARSVAFTMGTTLEDLERSRPLVLAADAA